ncbi:MAG: hypothetical protein Q7S29_04665 [Candidatus Peribacter sp.]|nr:hypothetical protein [Candidatus Peribacter sp.]
MPIPLHFIPPAEVARYAAEGLRLRRTWKRGGTMVGVARARDLKNRRPLSRRTILRMVSFFARHEVDKRGKDFGNPDHPSNGLIAWFLWGGDPGKKWANEIKAILKSSSRSTRSR